MDGIDLTWNRVGPDGRKIEAAIDAIEHDFSADHPAAAIPSLINVYRLIDRLPDPYW